MQQLEGGWSTCRNKWPNPSLSARHPRDREKRLIGLSLFRCERNLWQLYFNEPRILIIDFVVGGFRYHGSWVLDVPFSGRIFLFCQLYLSRYRRSLFPALFAFLSNNKYWKNKWYCSKLGSKNIFRWSRYISKSKNSLDIEKFVYHRYYSIYPIYNKINLQPSPFSQVLDYALAVNFISIETKTNRLAYTHTCARVNSPRGRCTRAQTRIAAAWWRRTIAIKASVIYTRDREKARPRRDIFARAGVIKIIASVSCRWQ